jgi:hypothetical protein
MDQNEEIFMRFMNDPIFQKLVTSWAFVRGLQEAAKNDLKKSRHFSNRRGIAFIN